MTGQPTKMRMHWSFLTLLAVSACAERLDQTRWSRQISSYTSDISDWVPLTGPLDRTETTDRPIKRQAVAQPRILSEPFSFPRPQEYTQDFPGRSYFQSAPNRQLYLQSVPSAPQNYLTEKGFGHGVRFGLAQPNFPLSQGFVAPNYPFENVQQQPRPHIATPQIYAKPILPISPQAKPFINSQVSKLPEPVKFVDGYKVENATNTYSFSNTIKKKPQSLQKIKLNTFEKSPKIADQLNQTPQKSKLEREEVQLLYVPVESLNRGQIHFKNVNQEAINSDFLRLQQPNAFQQSFPNDFHRNVPKAETFEIGSDFYNFNTQFREQDQVPKFSTVSSPFPTIITTTAKPRKLKPHQPPLAVFLTHDAKKGNKMKVSDVLASLKDAKTIAVLDTVTPENSPTVFIGPSSLHSPENYVKFELPYLSNIEHSDKKLRQLPFFVAPLSYNTPDGFAKIPFPSPHVGSVIVNAQIKETSVQSTPIADVIPNSYTASPPSTAIPKRLVTQNPTFSYYSTVAPKTNSPVNQFASNYYSFEPQTVTSVRPSKFDSDPNLLSVIQKKPSYFLSNVETDIKSEDHFVNFPTQVDTYKHSFPPVNKGPGVIHTHSTTPRTTTSSTTTTTRVSTTPKTSSTYPSQLLETHNPYSINQAFHLSTPLDDDEHIYEEYTPGYTASSTTPSRPPTTQEVVKQIYQDPTYIKNDNSETHYNVNVQTPSIPSYNSNGYTINNVPQAEISSSFVPSTENVETSSAAVQRKPTPEIVSNISNTATDANIKQLTRSPNYYQQYEDNVTDYKNNSTTAASTITSTTTTRRTPLRNRGRPHTNRYTVPKTENRESTTRKVATRLPIRERKPLTSRTRYNHNKITTERSTRKQIESTSETSTRSFRTKTRGRVHYKPTDNIDEIYESKRNKTQNKDDDLAYQRDILHQNYPVTLMERTSTVDIEAITEPTSKYDEIKSSEIIDSEQSYSAEKAYINKLSGNTNERNSDIRTYSSISPHYQTEASSYVPKVPSTRGDDYIYQSRSSPSQIDAILYSSSENTHEYTFTSRLTTPVPRTEKLNTDAQPEAQTPTTEQSFSKYSLSNEYSPTAIEESRSTIQPDFEIIKTNNFKTNNYDSGISKVTTEENLPQTTATTKRVRTRLTTFRHQPISSTEASITQNPVKSTRPEIKRRPIQPVTYRPAFDKTRTTMKIEEIEADLKTKQVHTRPNVQDHRHPVYKPDPTTEPSISTVSSEATKTRDHFRRRRPPNTYTTSTSRSSEALGERKTHSYEVKNRFRGRRPTERPTKPELQTEANPTTTKYIYSSRYNQRPKLSERFNKNPIAETVDQVAEPEDQDSNYSINRPKYAFPEDKSLGDEKWSPKISSESFKPYNPNDIQNEKKIATTEERLNDSDNFDDSELDIITARNNYEQDILVSVTPASNKVNKKIPEIPPTLEALLEQSKNNNIKLEEVPSSFESMLEQVMKTLEEQDENEYTKNVKKHKGGEIGEIPPERVITSGENYSVDRTTIPTEDITITESTTEQETTVNEEYEEEQNDTRRGYWKKVNVRPIPVESFEVAESQFYKNTVNRLGGSINLLKTGNEKYSQKSKPTVTTYKPKISIRELATTIDDEIVSHKFAEKETPKIKNENNLPTERVNIEEQTTLSATSLNPGEMDLGTGSPDSTIMDNFYISPATESSTGLDATTFLDRSDGLSFMDYLFGVTSPESDEPEIRSVKNKDVKETNIINNTDTTVTEPVETETNKNKVTTTESFYIPDEITTVSTVGQDTDKIMPTEFFDIKKINGTEGSKKADNATNNQPEKTFSNVSDVETSSISSFLDPNNVVSTSMSTEISHETEICFRGKCIKANKNLL